MKLYFVAHDTDNGDREEWSVFYTPIEVYPSKELQEARVAYLEEKHPSRTTETWEGELSSEPRKPLGDYEEEGNEEEGDEDVVVDGNDLPDAVLHTPAKWPGIFELLDDAAKSKSTDIHIIVDEDGATIRKDGRQDSSQE